MMNQSLIQLKRDTSKLQRRLEAAIEGAVDADDVKLARKLQDARTDLHNFAETVRNI